MTSDLPDRASDTPSPGRLGLHVLGGGIGESVVLELPQAGWGVIDCYAGALGDPATNLTVQFLRRQQVRELEFVTLTHPHADHFRGLLDLFDAFPVRQFWRFGGLSSRDLPRLVFGLEQAAQERPIRRRVAEARYLEDVFRRVGDLRSQGLQVTAMQDAVPLFPLPQGAPTAPGVARIFSLAPLSNTIEAYQDQLNRCFDANGRLFSTLPPFNQNLISAALRVVYGDTTLILGGDVERGSWQEIVDSPKVDNAQLSAQAVKVSHHGSPTGYCPGLWALFCAAGEPTAIITPFSRYGLPTLDTYYHIVKHTRQISTTCRPAMTFLPRPVDDINPAARLALRSIFPTFRSTHRFENGVCSFWFDDKGTRIAQEFTGAAGWL